MDKPNFEAGCCSRCGQFSMYPELHNCPPKWEVAFGETPEEGEDNGIVEVYEHDAAGAVEMAADEYDSDSDYIMARNGSGTAFVRKDGEFTWKKYNITAEQITTYTANES